MQWSAHGVEAVATVDHFLSTRVSAFLGCPTYVHCAHDVRKIEKPLSHLTTERSSSSHPKYSLAASYVPCSDYRIGSLLGLCLHLIGMLLKNKKTHRQHPLKMPLASPNTLNIRAQNSTWSKFLVSYKLEDVRALQLVHLYRVTNSAKHFAMFRCKGPPCSQNKKQTMCQALTSIDHLYIIIHL